MAFQRINKLFFEGRLNNFFLLRNEMRKKQKKLGEGKKHQQQISANLLETVLFIKKLQIFYSNKTTQKLGVDSKNVIASQKFKSLSKI